MADWNGVVGTITFERRVFIAHLAAIVNRMSKHRRENESIPLTVQSISAFVTECAREFDLNNDEQMLLLRFVVNSGGDFKALLESGNPPA